MNRFLFFLFFAFLFAAAQFVCNTAALPVPSLYEMQTLVMPAGITRLQSATIANNNSWAIFGTKTVPGQAVKINIPSFTFESQAEGDFGSSSSNSEDNFNCVAKDRNEEFVYFGAPNHIVKFRISTMQRVAGLTLSATITSGVVDSQSNYLYFGSDHGSYSHLDKIDIRPPNNLSKVAQISKISDGGIRCMVIDHRDEFIYAGTNLKPAMILRYTLSPNFARNDSIRLRTGEDNLQAGVIDPGSTATFFSTATSRIVKIDLTTFSHVGSIAFNAGEYLALTGVMDPRGEFTYWSTSVSLKRQILKFEVANFSRVAEADLTGNALDAIMRYTATSVIDTNGIFVYFAIHNKVNKICLVDCGGGHWYDSATRSCVACPIGTASAVRCSLTPSDCAASNCRAGTFCDAEGMAEPTPCAVGTFSTAVGATTSTVCRPCPAGVGTLVNGSTSCEPCPAGAFVENRVCVNCTSGTWSSTVGAAASSVCQTIPAGYFAVGEGAAAFIACPPGSWSAAGATSCTSCLPGFFQPSNASASCRSAPPGTYVAGAGARSPTNCSGGYASSAVAATRSSTCSVCGPEFFAPPGSAVCTPCPLFSTTDGKMSQSECRQIYTLGTTAPAPTAATFPTLPPVIPEPTASPTTSPDPFITAVQAAATRAVVITALEDAIGAAASATIQVRLFLPVVGLGAFIATPELCGGALSEAVPVALLGADSAVTLGSSSVPLLADALARCVALTPSPAMLARNLTDAKLLGVQVTLSLGTSSTRTATAALPLNEIALNIGPVLPGDCGTTQVPRGVRFSKNLGSVFTHPLLLPLTINVAQADGFALPPTLRVTSNHSGYVSARGVLGATVPLVMVLSASDNYRVVTATCALEPIYLPLRFLGPPPAAFHTHVGAPFSFAIPTMFEGSNTFFVESVTRAGGFPLPSTMRFEPSGNTLVGELDEVGVFNFTVLAADIFDEVVGFILVEVTNAPPVCNASSLSADDLTVKARVEFRREVALARLCHDPDAEDKLRFAVVNESSLPTWLRHSIAGAGGSTPTLVLTGAPPDPAVAVSISITASDAVSSSAPVAIQLIVPPNRPPRVVGALLVTAASNASTAAPSNPVMTMNPGETRTIDRAKSDLFVDPDGDTLTFTIQLEPEDAASWITFSTTDKIIIVCAPEDVEIDATEFEDQDVIVNVTATDPFGGVASVAMTVQLRLSTWQRAKLWLAIGGAVLSAILSFVGYVLLAPIVINWWRSRSRTIPCPLSAQSKEYTVPEEAASVELMHRPGDLPLQCLRDFTRHFSTYLYDELTLAELPLGEPPSWLELGECSLTLQPGRCGESGKEHLPEPDVRFKNVVVRIFDSKELLLARFVISYGDAVQGWSFDDDDSDADSLDGAVASVRAAAAGATTTINNVQFSVMLEQETEQLRRKQEEQRRETEKLRKENTEVRAQLSTLSGMMERLLGRDGGTGGASDDVELDDVLLDNAAPLSPRAAAAAAGGRGGGPSRRDVMSLLVGHEQEQQASAAYAAAAPELGAEEEAQHVTLEYSKTQKEQRRTSSPKRTPKQDSAAWRLVNTHHDML